MRDNATSLAEFLNAVIAPIRDVHVAKGIDRYAIRGVELSVAAAVAPV